MLSKIKKELNDLKNPKKIPIYKNFFKTGKGDYGEGDVFLGLNTKEMKKVAKDNIEASLDDINKLLDSKIHEHRSTACFILVLQYQNAIKKGKEDIVEFYIKNTKKMNNWDLVDSTAYQILGDYLLDKDQKNRKLLYKLGKSKNLWEKRIAIISTYAFIRNNQFEDTLKISEILLKDTHDLIHKAVGWMLREVGKKNQEVEEKFLKKRVKISKKKFSACQKSQSDFSAHYKDMPRTMLRYAIERFEETKRQDYLKGRI
jgi:3-methyladenine DNA glycosylase AlkD